LFMEQDFYFEGGTGHKFKAPIDHIYKDKQKLKELVKKMRDDAEKDRAPSDYKELRELIATFPWFKENIHDMEFNATDAVELCKHVKIKYFKSNEVVYLPGYSDQSLYFILRGRVAVGLDTAKD
jgi:CRP-like cAMP-binding protein